MKSIEDVPDEVAQLFLENEIKGSELLALDRDGLKDKRVGTICILLDKISALKREASQGVVTLIEHSPYCFGKILDYLRLSILALWDWLGILLHQQSATTREKC